MSTFPIDLRAASRAVALLAAATLGVGASARGHFLWLLAEPEGDAAVVRAFLAEQPVPDLPMFLKAIEGATYTAGGRSVAATPGEETYRIEPPTPGTEAIDGVCRLGLMSRDGLTFRIVYTARVQLCPAGVVAAEEPELLRVRLEATDGGGPVAVVRFEGEPAAGAEVRAFLDDGTDRTLTTDDEGRVAVPGLAEGRAALLAKWPDGRPGRLDGAPFDETRHYATLTVATDEVADRLARSAQAVTPPPLAEPISSFGAAVADGRLYVYGGHTGRTHHYHTGTADAHFRRLDLDGGIAWEDLPGGPGLQGVALAEHAGRLYRVGGMSARNAEGEPSDLVSTAAVACYDPETNAWADLPPLPEPRSTHDVAVLDGDLYVVGGWSMRGGDSINAAFLDDALRLDLDDPAAGWETLPTPPFRRRALAAAAAGGRLYVIGGLTEDGEVVREVDVYDPATGSWSKGPELPGVRKVGFAPAACNAAGRLYVSGADGVVHRLDDAGTAWERVGSLAVGRLSHHLLPGPAGDLVAVGGSSAGGLERSVERFRPVETADRADRVAAGKE